MKLTVVLGSTIIQFNKASNNIFSKAFPVTEDIHNGHGLFLKLSAKLVFITQTTTSLLRRRRELQQRSCLPEDA